MIDKYIRTNSLWNVYSLQVYLKRVKIGLESQSSGGRGGGRGGLRKTRVRCVVRPWRATEYSRPPGSRRRTSSQRRAAPGRLVVCSSGGLTAPAPKPGWKTALSNPHAQVFDGNEYFEPSRRSGGTEPLSEVEVQTSISSLYRGGRTSRNDCLDTSGILYTVYPSLQANGGNDHEAEGTRRDAAGAA